MKKMHQRADQNRRGPQSQKLAVAIGDVQDPEAFAASIEIDGADDHRWLDAHPEAEWRERLTTALEVQAFGHPPDTVVVICRDGPDTQFRYFMDPIDLCTANDTVGAAVVLPHPTGVAVQLLPQLPRLNRQAKVNS